MKKRLKIGGIILAAGLSLRFGDEKLLASYKGRPLGSHVVRAALASRLDPVVLVTRPELAPALVDYQPGLLVVNNEEPLKGQSLSLSLGLEALGQEAGHALILLADQPLITPELINRFVGRARAGERLAALWRDEENGPGAFCPPVLFGKEFFDRLRGLSGDQGGRDLLARHRDEVSILRTDQPLATLDIDRPQDLARITKRVQERQDALEKG